MLKHILLLSVVFLLITSCKEEQKLVTEKLNPYMEIKIKAERLITNIDSIISPGRILIIKDHLIISDFKGEKSFHIIDLKNNKYLNSFANKGQGPSEIVTPWNLSKIDDRSFLITDITQKKVLAFDLGNLLENKSKAFLEKNINQNGMSTSVTLYQDDLFYIDAINGAKRLYKQSIEEDKGIEGYGKLIDIEGENNDRELVKAQLSDAFMKANNGHFIFAYKYYPLIELFDLKTNKWISITSPYEFTPDYSVVEEGESSFFAVNKDTKNTFIDLAVTDKYIYALYSGEILLDNYYSKGKEVFVYDYDGNLIKKYYLDQELVSFDISGDSFIYGLNVDILPELFKFDLTKQ
jgi:hypothetical protein